MTDEKATGWKLIWMWASLLVGGWCVVYTLWLAFEWIVGMVFGARL